MRVREDSSIERLLRDAIVALTSYLNNYQCTNWLSAPNLPITVFFNVLIFFIPLNQPNVQNTVLLMSHFQTLQYILPHTIYFQSCHFFSVGFFCLVYLSWICVIAFYGGFWVYPVFKALSFPGKVLTAKSLAVHGVMIIRRGA
jgi:hypothetical protein